MKWQAWILASLMAAPPGCAQTGGKSAPEKEKEKKDVVSIDAGDAQVRVTGEGGVKIEAGGVKLEVPGGIMGGSGSTSETEKEILIGTSNQAVSYDCKGRSARITGSGNMVTLTGECRDVAVNGTGNAVVVDAVESIVVEGTGNGVQWKRALGGQAPKTRQSGIGNAITKAGEEEE